MSGTIWMYSDRMDDWDIMFAQKSFITYREGCDYYDLTEKVMTRLAQEAGAVYKMGNRFVRIRRDVFEEYLREQYRKEMSSEGENQLSEPLNAFIISCVFICHVLIFTCKRHNKLNMRHCLCMFIFAYESEHW